MNKRLMPLSETVVSVDLLLASSTPLQHLRFPHGVTVLDMIMVFSNNKSEMDTNVKFLTSGLAMEILGKSNARMSPIKSVSMVTHKSTKMATPSAPSGRAAQKYLLWPMIPQFLVSTLTTPTTCVSGDLAHVRTSISISSMLPTTTVLSKKDKTLNTSHPASIPTIPLMLVRSSVSSNSTSSALPLSTI